MDSSSAEEYVNQRFKRRRFNVEDRMDSDSENASSHISPFAFAASQKNVFSTMNGESFSAMAMVDESRK